MDSKGIFSCKSFFEWLVNDESHPLFEHANVVWKSKVVRIFVINVKDFYFV